MTPIVGPGTQRIQPIWVDDVAAYFARGVEKPEAANRTFELGGPDVVTWNEFWSRLKQAQGARRPSVHVPFGLMRAQAAVLEKLPKPPVTRDQLKMLAAGDNVVSNSDAVDTFGLPLVPLDEQLRRASTSEASLGAADLGGPDRLRTDEGPLSRPFNPRYQLVLAETLPAEAAR